MAQNVLAYQNFWLRSPLETPKWVKDLGNGLKSIGLGGPFGAMLSCCDVVMSCFNLHLAVSEAFALHRNPREVHGRPKVA